MKHGSYVTYKRGCRCRPCTDAANRQQVQYRMRVINNGGPVMLPAVQLCCDRIRSLRAAGYSSVFLAEKTEIAVSQIRRLAEGEQVAVWLPTFHAIEQVWLAYRDFPGPDRRAATWALRRGWIPAYQLPAPPAVDEASTDDVAVDRVVLHGEQVPLTRAESVEAWRRLEARGELTLREIARRLHTSEKTVARWRSGEHRPCSSRGRKRSA